jgi:hypothetical protein
MRGVHPTDTEILEMDQLCLATPLTLTLSPPLGGRGDKGSIALHLFA